MSRANHTETESEKKSREMLERLIGTDGSGVAKVFPASSGIAKGAKVSVKVPSHYKEDKEKYPDASALEHVVAVGVQTAVELGVQLGAAKTGRFAPLASATSGNVGERANEAVHELFADARVANPTEEMHAQWQQLWEQRDRAERLHERVGLADTSIQARNTVAELVPLHMQLNVPLPSVPLRINASDSVETVCAKMDRYFDDIIRDYPDSTKRLLRDMYYNNKNIVISKNFLEKKAMQANWDADHSENSTVFRMIIDSRVHQCPIMFRCCKIHEIAIHIGQAHQTVKQAGWGTLYREIKTFNQFTEQSVALAEKILHDALPQEVIARDLKNIGDLSVLG